MSIEGKNVQLIYVRLLDELVDVYRPVTAYKFAENVYQIAQSEQYDPDDESWEFLPGAVVVVEPRVLSAGSVLLAIRPHDTNESVK